MNADKRFQGSLNLRVLSYGRFVDKMVSKPALHLHLFVSIASNWNTLSKKKQPLKNRMKTVK